MEIYAKFRTGPRPRGKALARLHEICEVYDLTAGMQASPHDRQDRVGRIARAFIFRARRRDFPAVLIGSAASWRQVDPTLMAMITKVSDPD